MCWDGKTRTAELTVNGVTLEGEPRDVERIFDLLNALRERAYRAERRLEVVRETLAGLPL